MITLNTDRGLIRIETLQELYELPGYEFDIDPKTAKLETIIGNYTFADFVRCGLSSCHTKHGKGYVVTTTDGRSTNIGKDCGKTHFDVDFETMRKKFDRDFQDAERRENLKSFQNRIPTYREAIERLQTQQQGADWVHRTIGNLTTPGKGVPDSIVETLRRVRLARDGTLTKPRFATKEEIAQIEVAENTKIEGPYYIDVPVGRIEGVSALFPENDLRELLVVGLKKLLDKVEALDVDSLSSRELRINVNQITGTEAKLRSSETAVEAGRMFLDADNLAVLIEFAEDADERQAFLNYLSSMTSAKAA